MQFKTYSNIFGFYFDKLNNQYFINELILKMNIIIFNNSKGI